MEKEQSGLLNHFAPAADGPRKGLTARGPRLKAGMCVVNVCGVGAFMVMSSSHAKTLDRGFTQQGGGCT